MLLHLIWNGKVKHFWSFFLLLLGSLIILLPLIVVFLTSFSSADESLGLTEKGGTWANYLDRFLLAFAHSTLVAIALTAFEIITSVPILVFVGQKQLIQGIGSAGIKS